MTLPLRCSKPRIVEFKSSSAIGRASAGAGRSLLSVTPPQNRRWSTEGTKLLLWVNDLPFRATSLKYVEAARLWIKHDTSKKNAAWTRTVGDRDSCNTASRKLFRICLVMLDPLTSLGLASNIVQLVHFSADLVSSVKEIHQNGSSINVQSLRIIASDLQKLSSDVTDRSWSSRASGKPLEEVEKVRQISA